uniref:Uncharacterized protein n=1 Tax=Ciona savignyi TaxID=51511 RepID=H2ZPJ7_CIOSA
MFTMLDESNMQNQHDNIAIGRSPRANSGEISLLPTSEAGTIVSRGRFEGQSGIISSTPVTSNIQTTSPVASVAVVRYCTDTCTQSMVRASGAAALGVGNPTTVAQILQLLSNPILTGNTILIQSRYNQCVQECL